MTRSQLKQRLADTFFEMRTAGLSPLRQAFAVAIGVFIGATPFWGVHILMCIPTARLLRLNLVTMYAGAQVTQSFVAPFFYFASVQVGAWLRRGHTHPVSVAGLRQMKLWDFAGDLFLGSSVLGIVVGVLLGAAIFVALRLRSHEPERLRIAATAARRYLEQGVVSWEYAWGKLKADPVYFALLERRLLPERGVLLDLGCGRGLLFALLHEAEQLVEKNAWPSGWPQPPRGLVLQGIEVRPRPVARARRAVGERASIEQGDIRSAELPRADAVTLLDVLHFLSRPEQENILARVRDAIVPGGVLLIREGDAGGGWRFQLTRAAEFFIAWFHGRLVHRIDFRPAAEWKDLLTKLGFEVEVSPMAHGTPFANVLLRAVKKPQAN